MTTFNYPKNVSILTPPEGEVPLGSVRAFLPRDACFNPHSPRRGSATSSSSSTCVVMMYGFNPHSPRRGSATPAVERLAQSLIVSILTPPEGEVPPKLTNDMLLRGVIVSILTPPEGEVPRRGADPTSSSTTRFNPHSPRRGSATISYRHGRIRTRIVSILTPPEGEVPLQRRSR